MYVCELPRLNVELIENDCSKSRKYKGEKFKDCQNKKRNHFVIVVIFCTLFEMLISRERERESVNTMQVLVFALL